MKCAKIGAGGYSSGQGCSLGAILRQEEAGNVQLRRQWQVQGKLLCFPAASLCCFQQVQFGSCMCSTCICTTRTKGALLWVVLALAKQQVTSAMDAEAAAPAAPDAPSAAARVAAEAPEPMTAEQPAAAAQEERSEPQQQAQQPAAEEPASAAADAPEPAPNPATAKKQAKPKAAPKTEVSDTSVITPGGRERKKVEHYKPQEAPAEKKAALTVQVQWLPNVHRSLYISTVVRCHSCDQLKEHIDSAAFNRSMLRAGRGHKAARYSQRCAACVCINTERQQGTNTRMMQAMLPYSTHRSDAARMACCSALQAVQDPGQGGAHGAAARRAVQAEGPGAQRCCLFAPLLPTCLLLLLSL